MENCLFSYIERFENADCFDDAHRAFLDWNRTSNEFETMYVIAYIRNTVNMKDEFYDGEIEFFNEALPKLTPIMKFRRKVENNGVWKHYLKLCSIGGKYSYTETLNRAGIPVPLSDEVVRSTAAFAEEQAVVFKAKL